MKKKLKRKIIKLIKEDSVLIDRGVTFSYFEKEKTGGHIKLVFLHNESEKTINISSTPKNEALFPSVVRQHIRNKTV